MTRDMSFQQPSYEEFRAFQIEHYQQRLAAATSTEEKAYLRRTLYNFKKGIGGKETMQKPPVSIKRQLFPKPICLS